MLFNYLSYIDENGIEKKKIGNFKHMVFCCIPYSYEKCDPSTIEMLDLLAHMDNKYYALSTNIEIKKDVLKLLSNSFESINLDYNNDFFILLESSSFVSGKPIGLKIFDIKFEEGDDPDVVFIKSLKNLQKEISSINKKHQIESIGVKIFNKLFNIFTV